MIRAFIPFTVCALAVLSACGLRGQDKNAPPQPLPPVAFPPLEHYAALWDRSIFTTRDLPSPDAPVGPIFTDSLSLKGIYEVDGAVVAVMVDSTTSQFMEARIGSDNELGIRIRKVQPGSSIEKTRVQLQKGDQAGWIGFSDSDAPSPAPAARQAAAPLQTRSAPPVQPANTPVATPLLPPLSPASPPAVVADPSAAASDVPLPPP